MTVATIVSRERLSDGSYIYDVAMLYDSTRVSNRVSAVSEDDAIQFAEKMLVLFEAHTVEQVNHEITFTY